MLVYPVTMQAPKPKVKLLLLLLLLLQDDKGHYDHPGTRTGVERVLPRWCHPHHWQGADPQPDCQRLSMCWP